MISVIQKSIKLALYIYIYYIYFLSHCQ